LFTIRGDKQHESTHDLSIGWYHTR
jgi:hypothetical protein